MNTPTKHIFGSTRMVLPADPIGFDVVAKYSPLTGDRLFIAHTDNKQEAKHIAKLPELYDALLEAVWHRCYYCGREKPLATEAILEHGCVKKAKKCECLPWIKLLQQVKDAK